MVAKHTLSASCPSFSLSQQLFSLLQFKFFSAFPAAQELYSRTRHSKASFFVTKYMRTVLFTILAAYRAAAPPTPTHTATQKLKRYGKKMEDQYRLNRRIQRRAPPSLQSDDGSPRTECETAASELPLPPQKKTTSTYFLQTWLVISSAAIFSLPDKKEKVQHAPFFGNCKDTYDR